MLKRIGTILILFFISTIYLVPLSADATAAIIKIADPALEKDIRVELSIPDRDLTTEDMQKLKSFYPKGDAVYTSLSGLEYATNLSSLYLPKHGIRDLTPLSNLTKLGILALNSNQIEDVCPIAGLTSLKQLIISNNKISNIGCLSGLTEITDLLAGNNRIADISSLKSMNRLKWVDLENNDITDLAPVTSLPNLEHIYMKNNKVNNIEPLLHAPVLFDIHLEDNPLNEKAAGVQAYLEKNGITFNNTAKSSPSGLTVTPVYLDDERILFDEPPTIQEGNTLVQFRPLFEKLGLSIHWDQQTSTVTGEKQGLKLELQIGNKTAKVNGKAFDLPVAPQMISDNTFVPTRFIGEALHFDVIWDSQKHAVRIYKNRQTLTTDDGRSTLTLSHKWKQTTEYNKNSVIVFMAADPSGFALLQSREDKKKLEVIPGLKEYIEIIMSLQREQNDTYTFSSPEPLSVGGHEAYYMTYQYLVGENKVTGLVTFIETDSGFYRITLLCDTSAVAEYKKEYEEIVSSFKELETENKTS